MPCEAFLCVYNHRDYCTRGDVVINSQGICYNCLFIDVPDDVMLFQKKRLLHLLEKDEQENE